jgi:hypothetical protein
VFQGTLEVDAEDVWIFALTCDDGARLWIDGELVVDHDGLHGAEEKRGEIALAPGRHGFRLEWFNKTGGFELDLGLGPVGGTLEPARETAFAHED